MIRGLITTRHVLFHPITLIGIFGLLNYFHIIHDCFDSRIHCFAEYLSIGKKG